MSGILFDIKAALNSIYCLNVHVYYSSCRNLRNLRVNALHILIRDVSQTESMKGIGNAITFSWCASVDQEFVFDLLNHKQCARFPFSDI